MACGSRMIYGIEIWGIKGDEELHKIRRGHFARRCLRLPAIAVNGAAEYKLLRKGRRGEMFCQITKFSLCILQM
jgi:hypothetical protein